MRVGLSVLVSLVLGCASTGRRPSGERQAAAAEIAGPEPREAAVGGGGSPVPTPIVETVGPFVAGVHGMAVADDGTLYFSDSFGNVAQERRVYTLTSPYDGEPVPTPIVGKTPAGLAWDRGTLLVCDLRLGTVTRWDAGFRAVEHWPVPTPWNVSRAPSGAWRAVTFDQRVFSLEEGGRVTELFSGLVAPFDLVSNDDSIWVSEQGKDVGDPGRLTRRGLDGSVLVDVDYTWDNPEGLARAPDGGLWVAETERGELIRVDADGTARVIQSGLDLPVVIAAAPSGELFVSTGGPTPRLLRVRFE